MIYKACYWWDTDEDISYKLFWEEQDAIDYINKQIRAHLETWPNSKEINKESELPLCIDFETECNYKNFRVMPEKVH